MKHRLRSKDRRPDYKKTLGQLHREGDRVHDFLDAKTRMEITYQGPPKTIADHWTEIYKSSDEKVEQSASS